MGAGLRKWLMGRGASFGSHPELSLPQQSEKEPKEEPPPPGELATLWRTVKDEPRSITSLVAAPRYARSCHVRADSTAPVCPLRLSSIIF